MKDRRFADKCLPWRTAGGWEGRALMERREASRFGKAGFIFEPYGIDFWSIDTAEKGSVKR